MHVARSLMIDHAPWKELELPRVEIPIGAKNVREVLSRISSASLKSC